MRLGSTLLRTGAAAVLLAAGVAVTADLLAGPDQAAPAPAAAGTPAPSPDGIPLAAPNAAAVTVASAANAWGGIRTGLETTLSDRVVHYDIDATLDPVKHTVTGRQKLTWRNRSSVRVKCVYVHL
jgi:hypothetical protein